MEHKAFTVRLDPDQAADLEAAAAADGISIAEAIRQAVADPRPSVQDTDSVHHGTEPAST
jgi:predicted HicB family RNase H-like nuclease